MNALNLLSEQVTRLERLSAHILDKMKQLGLDTSHVGAQGYGGVGNISGHTLGMQAQSNSATIPQCYICPLQSTQS